MLQYPQAENNLWIANLMRRRWVYTSLHYYRNYLATLLVEYRDRKGSE